MFNFLKQKPKIQKTLGQIGEEIAQAEYCSKGFSIIERNFFNTTGKQLGELDFIARDKTTIVFVEVKTRSEGVHKFGTGMAAVDRRKQLKILKAAKIYLSSHKELVSLQPRIDICEIIMGSVTEMVRGSVRQPIYHRAGGVDIYLKSVTILMNAVEDCI